MEKTKHTPGKWDLVFGDDGALITDENLDTIADIPVNDELFIDGSGTWRENAFLIASAPDLLEACKKAFDNIANMDAPQSLQDKGRKLAALSTVGMAISRANGKE